MSQDTESLSNIKRTSMTEATTSKRKRHRDNNIDGLNQRKKRKMNENNQKTMEQRYHDLFEQNLSLNDELSLCKREKDHYQERMEYYKEQYINLQGKLMIFEEDQINHTENEDDDILKSYRNNTINMNQSQNEHKLKKSEKNENIILSPQQHKHIMNTNKNEKLSIFPSPHHSNNNHHQNNEIETEDTMTDYTQIMPSLLPPESPYNHQSDQKNTSISAINSNINNNQQMDKVHGKSMIPKLENDCSHSYTLRSSNNIKNIQINSNNSNSCNTNSHSSSSYEQDTNDENKKRYILTLDNVSWDNCHFVSVDCRFCGKHFDEYGPYIVHLKTHFDTDPSKTWKRCNESGCDPKKKYDETKFIRHLSTHGHQHPFHCNQKTLDGKICTFSASIKNGLSSHLKTQSHKIRVIWNRSTKSKKSSKIKKDTEEMNDDNDAENDNNYIMIKKSNVKQKIKREEREKMCRNDEFESDDNEESDDDEEYVPISDDKERAENEDNYVWEDCHFISVDCKFCGKHFDDFNAYIIDLKEHFDNDPSKIWLKCNESGCDSTKIWHKQIFIGHLCGCHGYEHPFHCKMKILNGDICHYTASTKGGLIQHLATNIHRIHLRSKRTEKRKKDKEQMNDDNDIESDNNYVWNDCHFVSADCKYCGQHFVDYDGYIFHLKNHFDTDPCKTWRKCDESWCDTKTKKLWHSTQSFISHLCSHDHPYPYHCNVKRMDGSLCSYGSANKSGIISHLASRKHNIKLELS